MMDADGCMLLGDWQSTKPTCSLGVALTLLLLCDRNVLYCAVLYCTVLTGVGKVPEKRQ